MATALEITDIDIRLVRHDQGRITHMEAYPIPEGSDPITALGNAPLPSPLGPVRIIISHSDMLLRPMIQPPTPPERMDRIIRFELQSIGGDDDGMLLNWHVPAVGGTGDMRVLVQVAKKGLVDQLTEALANHGGKLQSLTDPAVALYHLYKNQLRDDQGTHAILDCGRNQVHITFVENGELVFYRSHKPGMDDLIKNVAELRGVDEENAERLLRKLGKNPPEDLVELIQRHCMSLASAINNNIRFAKTQLKITELDLHAVFVTGRGARLTGFTDHLSARIHQPVRILNPFAGLMSGLPAETMDSYAQLPTSWGNSLGMAVADQPILDVLEQVRAERKAFWQTTGALRAGVIAAAALIVVAIVFQFIRMGLQESAIAAMQGEGDGYVPMADKAQKDLNDQIAKKEIVAKRMLYLDNERRPARVVNEFLNIVASLQDAREMPIYISGYRLTRPNGKNLVQIELEGYAEDGAGGAKSSIVINRFKKELQAKYAVIHEIIDMPAPPGDARLPFKWVITILDRA